MRKGNDWRKVGLKWLKWTVATAGAGLAAAASAGQDVTDPQVIQQVAVAALLAGLFGGGQNALKHRRGPG